MESSGQIGELTEYISSLWERIHTHMRGGDFEIDEEDEDYSDREILAKCKHQNDLEELGGDIEEAKLAGIQLEEARKEIREFQDKLADSDAENDRHAKHVQKMQDDMTHLDEEVSRLKAEARNSIREKETVDEQVDNLKREYKRVQAELKDRSSMMDSDSTSEDLTKMKQENEVLKVEVARAEAAEAAKTKELAEYEAAVALKSEKLKMNSLELDSTADKVSALERAHRAKDAELAEAKEEAAAARARHSAVQTELDELRAQASSIRRQTSGAADELEEERNTTTQLRQKLKIATQDAEDERESTRTMKRERDRLQADVDDQETVVRKLRTEVNEISRTSFQSPFMVSPHKDTGTYGGVDTSLLDSSRLEMIHVAKKQIAMAESMLDESVVALEAKDADLNALRAQLRQAQIRVEELERQLTDAEQDKDELNLLRSQNIALQSELEAGGKEHVDYRSSSPPQEQRAAPPNRGGEEEEEEAAEDDGETDAIRPVAAGADGNVTAKMAAASGRQTREYEILLEEWEDQTWYAPVSDDPSNRSFPVNIGPSKAALDLQIIGPKWLILGRSGVQILERDGQHNTVASWSLSDIKRYATPDDNDLVTVGVSTRANAYAGEWSLDTSRGQAVAVFNHLHRLMKPIRRRARNNARSAAEPSQQRSVYAPGGGTYMLPMAGMMQGQAVQQGTEAYYF